MTEEAVDVRRIVHQLRQRWLLIVAVAVIGAGLGLGVAVAQAPSYLARTQVLLPPSGVDALGNPVRNVQTEVSIGGSAEVLSRAGQGLTPPIGITSLRHRVKVVAVTPDILEFRAKAGTGRDAALLADSVAGSYVSFSNDATAEVATTTLADLQAQASDLDQQIRQINAQIADDTARLATLTPQSPQGSSQSAIIDSLRQNLTDTARQLSDVNTKIADAHLTADLTRRGTRLLQPALVPGTPASPVPAVDAGMGLAAGLLLATVVVVVRGRDGHRLRRRDDIAHVVGAPVLLSLAVPRREGVDAYRALLERWGPSQSERWSIRRAAAQLSLEPPANLAVVTLAGDGAAPALALLTARLLASVDLTTTLVADTRHPDATALRAACHRDLGKGAAMAFPLSVHTGPVGNGNGVDALAGSQLTVTLVVADGGPIDIPTHGRRTAVVLAVSAGFATADQLAAIAVRCFDAGHPIVAVVVANPDPADGTTGRLIGAPVVDLSEPAEPSTNSAASVSRPVP